MFRKNLYLSALVLLFILSACGGGSGGSGGKRGNSSILDNNISFQSRCGVVVNGQLKNPAGHGDAEAVSVEPVTSDTVVVTRLEGENSGTSQLVKLHGVSGGNPVSNGIGVQRIREIFGNNPAALILPSEGNECELEIAGGGKGVVGQIYTSQGQSLTETLLSQGLLVSAVDLCQSEQLTTCYSQIESEAISPKRITDFLWKPISESNGNLVVLVDPFDISVVVTGVKSQTLINTGPSNDRGTTARSPDTRGSGFGTNVTVEFFDENGKRVLLNNGERSVIIPNGRERVRNFY